MSLIATIDQGDNAGVAPATKKPIQRRVEFDYLRAFVVVLVVWHHAILAYAVYSFINPGNPIATFSPVVDEQRWVGFDLLASLNDSFFMPLMFFVSGLFVWRSLTRKGAGKYVLDRFIRLGIPFIIGLFFVIPLAYYPAQLAVERVYGGDTGYMEFWLQMIRSGFTTAGPLWFLWLLLVFDCIAALLHWGIRQPETLFQERTVMAFQRPVVFFVTLLAVSTIAYLPFAFLFDPAQWSGVGPFVFQTNRVLFYLVYFLVGVAAGAYGMDRTILQTGGTLGRQWWIWLALGLVGYGALVVLIVGGAPQIAVATMVFAATCAALVIGMVAFFLRTMTRHMRILDNLAACAYGIYIVHYVFVTWLQYALLDVHLPAFAKGVLVFAGALALSWVVTYMLRRIPVVTRVI